MAKWFNLLKYLDEEQIDWVFNTSKEEHIKKNAVFIEKNTDIDSIYFVIQGLLKVFIFSNTHQPAKLLGPGEIVGEISFLNEGKSTAKLIAEDDTLVLKLPKKTLRDKLAQDQYFAANFYKSLANIIANRFRQTIDELEFIQDSKNISDKLHHESASATLLKEFQNFKQLIAEISKETLTTGQVSENYYQQTQAQFKNLFNNLNTLLGAKSSLDENTKKQLGKQAQIEFLPLLLLTDLMQRAYTKPRGYAGDYEMIELVYQNQGGGTGVIGPLIDKCFLNVAAACAVRNRRHILTKEILALTQSKDKTVNVASLACGPAVEIFDAYQQLQDKTKLKATLIDFDLHALAHAADKRDQLRLGKQIELINENLIYLALGKKKIEFKQFDLIYSVGLIDYFEDELVIKLINYFYDYLAPGGKIILGNFHPNNPDKALMEYILEWYLVHRTEEDMNNLFKASKFHKPCSKIQFEEQHINLFAECLK